MIDVSRKIKIGAGKYGRSCMVGVGFHGCCERGCMNFVCVGLHGWYRRQAAWLVWERGCIVTVGRATWYMEETA